MDWMRGLPSTAAGALLALTLAACGATTQGMPNIVGKASPSALPPVETSSVSSSALPNIAGSTVQGPVSPSLTGTPVLGGTPQPTPMQSGDLNGNYGGNYGNGPSLDPLAIPGQTAMGARDLSAGLTVDRLIGGWTLAAGNSQCRVNLTQTIKTGTARYRASVPGCAIGGLANVSSWAVVGSQVQLFDEAGSILAILTQTGNQFIGTAAGGIAVTMVS